jgi:hypothetical protein
MHTSEQGEQHTKTADEVTCRHTGCSQQANTCGCCRRLTRVSRMSSVRLPRRRADSSGRLAGPSALMHCCRKPPTALLCTTAAAAATAVRVVVKAPTCTTHCVAEAKHCAAHCAPFASIMCKQLKPVHHFIHTQQTAYCCWQLIAFAAHLPPCASTNIEAMEGPAKH